MPPDKNTFGAPTGAGQGNVEDASGNARQIDTYKSVPLLRTDKLSKIYRMGDVEVTALNNVNFTAVDRELIVILGPSGSGKSTFLNLIGGLDIPTSGQAWFRDQALAGASETALTRWPVLIATMLALVVLAWGLA